MEDIRSWDVVVACHDAWAAEEEVLLSVLLMATLRLGGSSNVVTGCLRELVSGK